MARITTLTYARLLNLGNYENARFEVTASVAEEEDPGEALTKLQAWLTDQIGEQHDRDRLTGTMFELERRIGRLERRAEDLGRKVSTAERKTDAEEDPDDLPF